MKLNNVNEEPSGYGYAQTGKRMRQLNWVLVGVVFALSLSATVHANDLETIIVGRSQEDRARDQYRHPIETLSFFEVKPGMTVVETLPGRGWYTRILVPYVGSGGRFFGANYSVDLFKRIFGDRWESRRQQIENWLQTFPGQTAFLANQPPELGAFVIGQAPAELAGQVDRVLFIRSLHHLNRFDSRLLDEAAAEAYVLLKPGGIVGVVQHRAPESNDSEWANGSQGYLKKSRVVDAFESAGFFLEATSELNSNPLDVPTENDRVWRLPPTLRAEGKAREVSLAIGESDRMTLKFAKPK